MELRKNIPITWQKLNSIIKDTDNQTLKEHMILPSLIFSSELSKGLQNILIRNGEIEEGQQLSTKQQMQLVHNWSQSPSKIKYGKLHSVLIDSLGDKDACSKMHSEILSSLNDANKCAQFIAGESYDLSLLFLNLFVACSERKGKLCEDVFFTPFNEYAGITTAVENVWDEFVGNSKKTLEYKDKREFLKTLTNDAPLVSFSFNNRIFDLHELLDSISHEDLNVRFAVVSIIASTWAVWDYVFKESQKHNLNESCPETQTVCAKLATLYDAIAPSKRIVWSTISEAVPSLSQIECMSTFIFPALQTCIKNFKEPITESDVLWSKWFVFKKSSDRDQSQFFNGTQKNLSTDYLSIMTDSSVAKNYLSGGLVSYNNYLYLEEVKKAWKSYADEDPCRIDNLNTMIKSLYSSIDNDHWIMRFNINGQYIDLREKLLSIEANDTIYKMAILSIIATTWATWFYCNDIYAVPQDKFVSTFINGKTMAKKLSEKDRCRVMLGNLCSMIFPNTDLPSENTANVSESYATEDPDQLLDNALIAIDNDNESKAVEDLVNLVTNYISIASAKTLAKAYDALNICKSRNWELPAHLSNVRQNELVAKRYGSITTNNIKHSILPEVQLASSLEAGYYFLRTGDDKEVSKYITSTKPQNWHPLSDWLNANSINTAEANLGSILVGQSNILTNNLRFIFVDSDYDKNIADALNILDIFKKITDAAISDPAEWGNIEIIIRCNQEQTTPLLDTAYSFLDECREGGTSSFAKNPVKIYMLDEKKRTADLLYAQHPLFYPLTSVRNSSDLSHKTFNLVIISNNMDADYTIWLIREAFWLLPHTRFQIRSKITVLSPIADELCYKTTTLCPGFSCFSKRNGKELEIDLKRNTYIDDISFPEIEYDTISMDSFEIQNKIANYSAQDILYYVVDLATDLEGINLATQIRELSVKKALQQRDLRNYTSDETVVAVRCQNKNYANLLTQLIIPKETEYDNRWFNDYKIIPFGTKSDIFSWDELVGGTIEFMSECMHYQYCTPAYESHDFDTPAPADYIWSYHRRLYNRTSSYSAAMALPYRLFEAGVVLPGWTFKNKNSYWLQDNRDELADKMDNALNPDILDELSKWEHSRWCCYLYSTGWLPATPEETKHYMNNGVTRHSLQIAKLHPCLCSWDDLIYLYSTLHKAYLGTEDSYGKQIRNEKFHKFSSDDDQTFQGLDTDNIQQTGDMLRARPLPRQKQSAATTEH